jgi:two-component system, LytTR family, response regulator
MKAIIVEDEIASQQYLCNLLKMHFPDITTVAIVDNVPAAIKTINDERPDILFVDVEIKMGTGFDVLASLTNVKAEIIFTTAFNQFAIDAFRHHAIDYLLKPMDDKLVIAAVSHCLERLTLRNNNQQIAGLLEHMRRSILPIKRLSIHTTDGVEFIDTNDIMLAEAKGNYTILKLKTGKKVTLSKKLKDVEPNLPEPTFFRVHHSYIVNVNYVVKYHKGRGGSIILSDQTPVPVSESRKDGFLRNFS